MLVYVSVTTFEKRPTPLYALRRNMNPTRSSQNNREQSQKWNVEGREERVGWKGEGLTSKQTYANTQQVR